LKPDVFPSLTEVRSGSTAPAHLFRRRGCTQALLPCENDQAKLDHFSRLACSTNLSKILPAVRLSGAVWIEAQAVTPGCPRTCCARQSSACKGIHRRFCANLLKLSNFHLHVNPNLLFVRGRANSVGGSFPDCESQTGREAESSIQRFRTAQNIKQRPDERSRTAKVRRRITPGSCNGLFSLGIPYRGPGVISSPDPTNQLPNSLFGQAQRPPGGSTAAYCSTATLKE